MLKTKRIIFITFFLLLQVLLYILKFNYLINYSTVFIILYKLYIVSFILYILKNKINLSYYIPWICIIILFPVVGTIMYIIMGTNILHNKNLLLIEKNNKNYHKNNHITNKESNTLNYLSNNIEYPITTNNLLKYYKSGELQYKDIIKEIKNAKKYIFIESFIINPGYMWNNILEILNNKSKKNIDIRIIYDDMGCMDKLPNNYPNILSKYNIKCIKFNKINTIFGSVMNNRDHRKIIIIDSKVAFIGGLNISDEYINKNSKLGNFKDSGISIKGDAVSSYIIMFLSIWNSYYKIEEDYNKYIIYNNKYKYNGLTVPYQFNPLSKKRISYDVYINIINNSKNYLYIFTPYLILDNILLKSIELAVKRGVEIKIVVPKIPDKKGVYNLMEYYFYKLINIGVKIYKYNDYIHSKLFLCDDKIATIGSINLNYRSLFLDFESGIYLNSVDIISEIKKDMIETINNSNIISKNKVTPNLLKKIYQSILLLLSQLM